MFGKLGDMMGKLKEMKQKADETKLILESKKIITEGAGGDIVIEMNGNRKLLNLTISSALQHGDKTELQNHLLQTINKALTEVEKINEEEMKKVAAGMLPGI
jgi:DNA-binding protein YbaB